MTVFWTKAARDLWRGRGRSALVVIATAVGLSGFFGVLATRAVLGRELDRSFLATSPASAYIVAEGVDDAVLATIARRPDVADVDARRIVSGRVRAAEGRWKRLVLFAIRDFHQLRVGLVTPDAGAWPPGVSEMLIERDAVRVAGADIGATLTVRTRRGVERPLHVAGRVHDPAQAQARMEDTVYGYIAPMALAALGEPTDLNSIQLLVAGNRFDAEHVRGVANAVKAQLERDGHPVTRVIVPPPGRHPHAIIMAALLLAMAAFGLLALALSGILVVNLLLATMTTERRQIGVMMATGATRGQVARIYLTQALLLGASAVVVSIPLGIAVGRAMSAYFAGLLNIDIASHAVPASIYGLVACVGLLAPVVAAAYPVVAATRLTVRAALVAGDTSAERFGTTWLERVLCRGGSTNRPWILGVRNSLRRPTRTLLTFLTLVVAGAFFITAFNVRTAMLVTVDRLFRNGDIPGVSRNAIDQHMLMFYVFLFVAAGVLGAIGSLGLMTTASLNTLDRRRELGVLRAIGASPMTIASIVVVESVFIATIAWLLAVAGAWPLSRIIGAFFTAVMFPKGLALAFAPAAVFGWLAISVLIGAAASLVPAARSSHRPISEVIAHE